MKFTAVLFRQHIGWHFKKHWHLQGKRRIIDTNAVKTLKQRGIPVYEPKDILGKKELPLITEVPDYIPQLPKLDESHPDWHNRVCYTYKDDNVLLEGLNQAKVIIKTVELQEGLPDKLLIGNSSVEIDRKVKRIILNSHLFDAEQQMLPKRKDPERPAWNFPRDYGVTDRRVNKLLVTKLLQLIEMISDSKTVRQRNVLHNLQFWYPFEKAGDLIQLQLRGDSLLTTSTPLSPVTTEITDEVELPDIFPVTHTVTLNTENIYKLQNIYPINQLISRSHPHTVFIHYNPTEVKNIYEEEVTDTQILGRSLMKTFAVAATYAKQTFGDSVDILPRPVTVQCVHTDGRLFHFGILQLNTLNLDNDSTKNVWYQTSRIPLFTSCQYKLGKPTLEGYNNEVIRYLCAFYNNS
ncbi:hypothetical protein ILUMI_04752 [Ignelater luminosus]|uniref:Large ribosomal subunit protein mL37 n=1 Tax=Ignelater luminosus TaxID=2038154 RepID=A0A8K0DDV3_IGNLU|nr:hypothetical protein ILUMI_04752 [Ignelater luminosus]